jgi:hypothetical protein
MKLYSLFVLLFCFFLAACQTKTLHIDRLPDGTLNVKYVKSQAFNNDSLEAVQITKDGESYTVEVKGINNEAQVTGAIAEGIARGLAN